MMAHDPTKLAQWSHEATERLNHLQQTGITDRPSLLLAILRDFPDDIQIWDASVDGVNNLLVRDKVNGRTD